MRTERKRAGHVPSWPSYMRPNGWKASGAFVLYQSIDGASRASGAFVRRRVCSDLTGLWS